MAEMHTDKRDSLEASLMRKKGLLEIIMWLKDHYEISEVGSLSKSSVYAHYVEAMCRPHGVEPLVNATFFGKLVKRAFHEVKYNRKGPRGHSVHHYTNLQRAAHSIAAAGGSVSVSSPLSASSPQQHHHHHHQVVQHLYSSPQHNHHHQQQTQVQQHNHTGYTSSSSSSAVSSPASVTASPNGYSQLTWSNGYGSTGSNSSCTSCPGCSSSPSSPPSDSSPSSAPSSSSHPSSPSPSVYYPPAPTSSASLPLYEEDYLAQCYQQPVLHFPEEYLPASASSYSSPSPSSSASSSSSYYPVSAPADLPYFFAGSTNLKEESEYYYDSAPISNVFDNHHHHLPLHPQQQPMFSSSTSSTSTTGSEDDISSTCTYLPSSSLVNGLLHELPTPTLPSSSATPSSYLEFGTVTCAAAANDEFGAVMGSNGAGVWATEDEVDSWTTGGEAWRSAWW